MQKSDAVKEGFLQMELLRRTLLSVHQRKSGVVPVALVQRVWMYVDARKSRTCPYVSSQFTFLQLLQLHFYWKKRL